MLSRQERLGGSAAGSDQRVDEVIRITLIAYAAALFILASGFVTQARWAAALWPFSYTSSASFAFAASIIAAAAASTLWCSITRNFRALVGGGADAVVITAPIAVYALMLGRKSLRMFALAAAATAIIALIITARYWRYPFRDQRPTPWIVRISFLLFIVALVYPGARMAAGNMRVLPWDVPREVTVIYGWAFLGAAVYFIYALIFPNWSNAFGQLLGSLAYDLILIWPLLALFAHVDRERRINLIIYTSAVIYSACIAIFYCFVNPSTRLAGRRSR